MRIAIVGGLALAMLAAGATRGAADIGPVDPARRACAGSPENGPCTLDDKPGTCHGPHPSRMYCDTDKPPSQGSGSAAGSAAGSAGTPAGNTVTSVPSYQPPAGSATGSAAEPAPSPGHKRGCAMTEPGSAALVGLAVVALGWRRRRRT